MILSEAERLKAVVRVFHDFLKNKSPFSYGGINGVSDELISDIGKEAACKAVELVAHFSEGSPRLNIEKNLTTAAVFHVLRNALEATRLVALDCYHAGLRG
jgi:hypothetical protein